MKNLKIIFSFFLVFFISCSDIGEDYVWNNGVLSGFVRKFGTRGYDYGWNISYSPYDQGLALVGSQEVEINGNRNLWAIKTDVKGMVIWDQAFGGENNEEGYDVIATSDGGFLFLGYSWSYGNSQQVFLVKTDNLGKLLWQKTYGGSMWEVGYSIISLKKGGYAIAGFSNSPGISSGNTDMLIIKIDDLGNQLWMKAYGNNDYPNHEWAYDIIETDKYELIVVGSRDRYDKGSKNALLIKVDNNGKLIWEKELPGDGQTSEIIYGITKGKTQDLYVSSGINTIKNPEIFKPKIMKIDASGNIEWQRIYDTNSKEYHHFNISNTANGDLILVGSSGNFYSIGFREDAFMSKIDTNGNIIWTNAYGTLDNDDWGWTAFEKPDGNIVMIGSTKSYNASLFDIYLVGTDPNGNLND